ncbi:hypothetical protein ACEPPN_012921 [Leptodophora sp. 'Broadleaf-Isolate-01']
MAPTDALSETLSSITAVKLDEITKQRRIFEDAKAMILEQVEAEPKLRIKGQLLLDGLEKFITTGEIKPLLTFSFENTRQFLKQAEYDPSISRKQLEDWQAKILNVMDIHSLKFEYASLCGRLVQECLSGTAARPKIGPKTDFGFETLAETEMLDQRMKWEALVSSPFNTDVIALQAHLDRLFKSSTATCDAYTRLRQTTAEFEKEMMGAQHFNKTSLNWVINGLLRSDLLTEQKRKILKDFQNNKAVLEEVADILNMRMLSIEKWEWDLKGIPVEQRRLLNGRSRFFHDDELLQAMLLRYIGMKWSVLLKAALAAFQSSPDVWKSASTPVSALDMERRLYFLGPIRLIAQPELTVESIRAKNFREEIFLEQLAERVDEQRGSYDDVANEYGDTRKSSLQITQSLLHTLRTEIIIKKGLCQDITILRTDFSSFGPSLPHLTITTVLKALGVSDKWVEFFRRTLEAPVKFIEDGPDPIVQIRRRGTPPSSPMSDFMAEAVLFCLDFTVNQETFGARMYRLHDDIWLWGSEKSCTKAWDVMIKYAKLTGLGFSQEKTGCVKIAKPGDVPVPSAYSTLPEGDISWGFLKLDADSGRFIINQSLVNKHVKELRAQLEACKSVIDYLQAWNIYGVRFFANNIGKPANCFGVAHVQMMLETFHGIQSQLFGSKEHSADTPVDHGSANDITSVLQQMIFSRFGVKVPEGYLYFPTFLGGLDLKNPFVTLGIIHDTIEVNPDAFMRSFFKEESRL